MARPRGPGLASAAVVYRHPLAFLLGLEGVALLRAQAGDDFDRAVSWHFQLAGAPGRPGEDAAARQR